MSKKKPPPPPYRTFSKTEKERRQRRAWALRRYRLSPRGRYQVHKENAARRGVPFLLTFDEWMEIWNKSKRWNMRGARAGGYVMSRYEDTGPYSVDNVAIVLHGTNVGERNTLVAAGAPQIRFTPDDDWRHVHEGID